MQTNYTKVIEAVLQDKVIKATEYVSPTAIIRAVRRTVKGKILKGNIQITLTIGKPNYAEREFISACKKAKEPFPIKKIQLKLQAIKKK